MEAFFAAVRILVVEDNRMNRDIVERQLRRVGCTQIATVTNGQEALDWLRQHRCDIIVTDCQMPVMDGYEMTRRIRSVEHGGALRLYIIALSASAMDEDIARCFSVGMDAHVAKPTQLAAIREALEKAAAAGLVQ
ncbi:response regulator [Noviherbaspirillum pedocola]|uniref:Response regulator n=1 Tax=Noviherbaspirillum pedocola TaxID=2801341 RepID=A0A934SW40_9BURK|nr:response regulator [Noviherbaspirillum pedocola]MBK4737655.1 response regulator [Noviherbaspirillum pedocola]